MKIRISYDLEKDGKLYRELGLALDILLDYCRQIELKDDEGMILECLDEVRESVEDLKGLKYVKMEAEEE